MNGTRVGYARCSTDEQDVDIQIEQLAALGVTPERIYIDRGFSGTRRTQAGVVYGGLKSLGGRAILPGMVLGAITTFMIDRHDCWAASPATTLGYLLAAVTCLAFSFGSMPAPAVMPNDGIGHRQEC